MTPQPIIYFMGPLFIGLQENQLSLNLVNGAPPMMTCSSSTSQPSKKRSKLTHFTLESHSKADDEVYFPDDVLQDKKEMKFMVNAPTPKWMTTLPHQKTLFKSLYVTSTVPHKSLKLSLNIQLEQNGPFLNLVSDDVRVISKPSKKKGTQTNAKSMEGIPLLF